MHETRSEFEVFTDSMPHLIWRADVQGTITYCNQRWIEYTGWDPRAVQFSQIRTVLHPDERDAAMAKWFSCLQSSRPFEQEYRLRRHIDGTYRWFLARAVPMRDANGIPNGWVGTATDIDEQRHTKHALEFVLAAEQAVAQSDTLQTAYENFSQIATKSFADLCIIHTFAEPDIFTTIAFSARNRQHALQFETFCKTASVHRLAAVARAIKHGAILAPIVNDEHISFMADAEEYVAFLQRMEMFSVLIVPLKSKEYGIIGTITLISRESGHVFSVPDRLVMEQIAQRIVPTLVMLRRLEEERRDAERLRVVSSVTQRLLAAADVDVRSTTLDIVCACIPTIADQAALYLHDTTRGLRLVAAQNTDHEVFHYRFIGRHLTDERLIQAFRNNTIFQQGTSPNRAATWLFNRLRRHCLGI